MKDLLRIVKMPLTVSPIGRALLERLGSGLDRWPATEQARDYLPGEPAKRRKCSIGFVRHGQLMIRWPRQRVNFTEPMAGRRLAVNYGNIDDNPESSLLLEADY